MPNAQVLVAHSIPCKRMALCEAWQESAFIDITVGPE